MGRRPPAADTASLAPHLAGGCVLWEGASPAASRGTAEPGSAPPPPPPPAVTPEEAEEVSESRLGGSRTLGASRASWERPWSAARSRGGASLGLQSVRRRRPSLPPHRDCVSPRSRLALFPLTLVLLQVLSVPVSPVPSAFPGPVDTGKGVAASFGLWF